jgi:hypothetical protein
MSVSIRDGLRALERQGEDNIWRTAKAAGEEMDRLDAARHELFAALIFARERLLSDGKVLQRIAGLFGKSNPAMQSAKAEQAVADAAAFKIIDGALLHGARFPNVSCSHCGRDFGPGDHGFSHCDSHVGLTPRGN